MKKQLVMVGGLLVTLVVTFSLLRSELANPVDGGEAVAASIPEMPSEPLEGAPQLAPSSGSEAVKVAANDRAPASTIDDEFVGPLPPPPPADVTLRARVVDGTGRPVRGAVVQLARESTRRWWAVRRQEVNDETGVATFLHAQKTVTGDEGRAWTLRVEALLEEPVERPLDPDALPEEVVVLTVPAVGSVEVEVLAEDWTPFLGAAQVSLGIVREGEPRELSLRSDIQRPILREPSVEGLARFPMVEVGRELEVEVRGERTRVATYAYGPGPTHSGDTARLKVRLGSDHPVVLLRALDAQAKPLAGAPIAVRLDEPTMRPFVAFQATSSTTTDEEGLFQTDLSGVWTEAPGRTLSVTLGSVGSPKAIGTVDLSRPLRPGINDLGDVVLGPVPVFVAGRVVSESGDPVPGASLVLETRSRRGSRWSPCPSLRHRTDSEGRFEVLERRAGDGFRLGVSRKGWAAPLQEFSPGETDLLIVACGEGAIGGRVLLAPEIPNDLLTAQVIASSGGESLLRARPRRESVKRDGRFRLGELLPGAYTVSIRAQRRRAPLLTVSDVLVRSGETTDDPRLAAIDLREDLHLHRISVLPPAGARRSAVRISHGPAGTGRLEDSLGTNQAETALISTAERIDLEIEARGCCPERIEGLRGDAEIQLRRGPAVRLVLASEVGLPEPPLLLQAVLVRQGNDQLFVNAAAEAFDDRRAIVVRAPGSGRMKVLWGIAQRSGRSLSMTGARLESEQLVEVLEGAGEQRVEVRLSREELEQLLEQVR